MVLTAVFKLIMKVMIFKKPLNGKLPAHARKHVQLVLISMHTYAPRTHKHSATPVHTASATTCPPHIHYHIHTSICPLHTIPPCTSSAHTYPYPNIHILLFYSSIHLPITH